MGMLRNFRLQKAMEMLRKNPNWTTKEIAFKVGFKEYSHFSASFKKQFHLSPTEWRKAHV
jgi:AraC-like DNA-binding protein